MPPWQRVYLASCVGVVAYALTYVGIDYAGLPRLFHYQLDRRWGWAVREVGLPSGYVGLWAAALVVGGAAAGVAWLVLGRCRRPASERALGLALAWTLTAFAIALGYYTWNNWP